MQVITAQSANGDNVELIGSSAFLARIAELAERIRQSKSTILISGETGTGKSLLGRYLFEHSETYKKILKIIPLSEIPENLFEDQLFGHRKGAFTHADRNFEGKIKAADGGTIILEDIASLPLYLQAKILRVIQEKQFERIGDVETISVDIRIIATTNTDLRQLIKENRFRKDLFFRLNVIELQLLPLRKRADDIEPLALHFMEKISIEQGKEVRSISNEAVKELKSYGWPGNVRELRSEIERAISLMEPHKKVLESSDFSARIRLNQHEVNFEPVSLAHEIKMIEREKIIEALIRNNGNKGRAAEDLGISRRTLYNKLEELKIGI